MEAPSFVEFPTLGRGEVLNLYRQKLEKHSTYQAPRGDPSGKLEDDESSEPDLFDMLDKAAMGTDGGCLGFQGKWDVFA